MGQHYFWKHPYDYSIWTLSRGEGTQGISKELFILRCWNPKRWKFDRWKIILNRRRLWAHVLCGLWFEIRVLFVKIRFLLKCVVVAVSFWILGELKILSTLPLHGNQCHWSHWLTSAWLNPATTGGLQRHQQRVGSTLGCFCKIVVRALGKKMMC